MLNKGMLGTTMLLIITLLVSSPGLSQEDRIVQTAINTIKTQMRVPADIEIKFAEKKESPIADFYAVKLILSAPDRDIPVVVYVDRDGERVIIGNLIVKGENVTQKEAGQPRPRKIDMAQMDLEKSPFRGAADGKVTIVEFSNFQCPYCLKSWSKMQEVLGKRPQDVKYVFKHFPLQAQGKAFDISEMVAATQEVSSEAFWTVHDYLFTPEGQSVLSGDKEAIRKKIDEKLNEKGFDGKVFLAALEAGKGKKRVQEDVALGTKLRVRGTPTTIMNGDQVRSPITDQVLDQYLKK
jgi:protein-disulfide isomerase